MTTLDQFVCAAPESAATPTPTSPIVTLNAAQAAGVAGCTRARVMQALHTGQLPDLAGDTPARHHARIPLDAVQRFAEVIAEEARVREEAARRRAAQAQARLDAKRAKRDGSDLLSDSARLLRVEEQLDEVRKTLTQVHNLLILATAPSQVQG